MDLKRKEESTRLYSFSPAKCIHTLIADCSILKIQRIFLNIDFIIIQSVFFGGDTLYFLLDFKK